MRARFAVLCLSLVLLAGAVPVDAQTITFEEVTVSMTAEEFIAELRGDRYSPSDSNWLRGYIDTEFGNGDGQVTQAEVDASVAAAKSEMNAQIAGLGGAVFFSGIRMGEDVENARASVTRSVTDIRFNSAILGAVGSDAPVTRDLDARLTFPDTPRSRITVVFADDFRVPFSMQNPKMEWEVAIFRGAEPWAIDPATIEPASVRDEFLDGSAFRVAFDDMGSFSSKDQPLTFQIVNTSVEPITSEDGRRSPAPGFLLVAVVALAALALRRPRA